MTVFVLKSYKAVMGRDSKELNYIGRVQKPHVERL